MKARVDAAVLVAQRSRTGRLSAGRLIPLPGMSITISSKSGRTRCSRIHEGVLLCQRKESASDFCSLRRGEDEQFVDAQRPCRLYTIGCAVYAGITSEARSASSFGCRRIHGSESATGPNRRNRWRTGLESHRTRCSGYRLPAAQPAWELEINPHALPYLMDHAIRGAVVFPGAGYVEMALAAGAEVFGTGEIAVEDIRFDRALFVRKEEYVKAQISIDPADASFEVHSRAEHALGPQRGRTAGPGKRGTHEKVNRTEVESDAPPAGGRKCYRRFEAQGFQYGPAFQKISRIALGDGEALA